jgi:hypothetical protein
MLRVEDRFMIKDLHRRGMLMYAAEPAAGTGNSGVLGSAQCDEIDPMPVDYHPLGISSAKDPAGRPVIAYQARTRRSSYPHHASHSVCPPGGNCGPEDDRFPMYPGVCAPSRGSR